MGWCSSWNQNRNCFRFKRWIKMKLSVKCQSIKCAEKNSRQTNVSDCAVSTTFTTTTTTRATNSKILSCGGDKALSDLICFFFVFVFSYSFAKDYRCQRTVRRFVHEQNTHANTLSLALFCSVLFIIWCWSYAEFTFELHCSNRFISMPNVCFGCFGCF